MGHDETTRPGASDRDGETLRPDQRFADLRIDAIAGRGGSGIVYRAWDEKLDQPRALKVLFADLGRGGMFRERFERETRAIASLEHPSVVRVHRAGEYQGQLFLSMQFVDGETLADVIAREAPMSLDRTIGILAQVASALDAAHAAGIVHRDVKPANILVSADRAYLTDFGIAKHAAAAEPLTEPGELIGTANYVSPEQVSGGEVGTAADVYSLACVAYECLTGDAPFTRPTRLATLVAHTSDPRPGHLALSRSASSAINLGMAIDPAERPRSAGDFVDALTAGNRRVSAARPGSRWVAAVVVVGAIAAGALLAIVAIDDEGGATAPRGQDRPVGGEVVASVELPHAANAVTVGTLKIWTTGESTLSGLDPTTDVVDPTIPRPGTRMSAAAVGLGFVWAIDGEALLRFNTETSTEPLVISLRARPTDLVITTEAVWVATSSGEVVKVAATGTIGRRIPIEGDPVSLVADPTNIWVASKEAGRVTAIDTRSNEVRTSVDAEEPIDLAVTDEAVWFLESDGELRAIDRVTLEESGAPVVTEPGTAAVTAGFGSLWLANPDRGEVDRVDPERPNRWAPIELKTPTQLASGPESIWVAQGAADLVTEIRPAS